MKPDTFAELLTSANEALAHAKGKRSLRTTALPAAPAPMTSGDVRKVRSKLRASQAVFARYLNVSTKLVQAWEASARAPAGPALVLLNVLQRQPGLVDTLYSNGATGKPRRSAAGG